MKKKLTILAVVLLILAATAYGGYRYFQDTYIIANEEIYPRDLTQLDLRGIQNLELDKICELTHLETLDLRGTGLTLEEYETVQAALPDCKITWELFFQGRYLSLDTPMLAVNTLTDVDIDSLKYLTKLERIDATGCSDLEMVWKLRETYPQIQVTYQVALGQRQLHHTITSLVVALPDLQELSRQLKYLPQLKKVTLTGDMQDLDGVLALEEQYPELEFVWYVELLGKWFDNSVEEIDLSGTQVEDLEEIAALYPYLHNLQRVVLCDSGKTSQELDAFWKKYPQVRVIWSVKVQWVTLRTDTTAWRPYSNRVEWFRDQDLEAMKYLVDMVCLDLGHMPLDDISFLEYMPNLEYLILADCGLRDITPVGHLKKLKYLEIFMNIIPDISCLANCEALEDLNMCYNHIGDISALMGLKNLKNVWGKYLRVPRDDWTKLEEAVPGVFIMYGGNKSSTGNGWRSIPNYFVQRDLLGMWYMFEY